MSVEHVSGMPQFQSIIRDSGNKLVVVDFHAAWCGPCRAIAPQYESLARRYQGRARFLKVDVDEAQDVARASSVSAMPTFHFYRRGTRVAEFSGADPTKLDRTIEQHAPTSAELSFSGEGQRLGNNSSNGPNASSGGGGEQQQQPQGSSSMREALALAAARRMQLQQQAAQENGQPSSSSSPTKQQGSSAAVGIVAAEAGEVSDKQPAANGANSNEKPGQNDARLTVNQTFARQMINEMGFPRVRAEKALILTGNKSLEDAVEWCFEHADDADIDEPLQVVSKSSASLSSNGASPSTSQDPASSSSASTVKLSVEEAKRRADELYAKARSKREVEEKREAVEREKNRVRSGKEVTAARAKLQEAERKRMVEERRRQKREDQEERQRVRNMLQDDKEARRQKFRMPGNPNESSSNPAPQQPPPVQPKQQQQPPQPVSGGKIQFRLPDGSRLEADFTAEQTVGDVIKFLTATKPELAARAIKLSQQYPRKVFSQADYASSLSHLKLLPRGVLMVTYS